MERLWQPLVCAMLVSIAAPAVASGWALDAATWARPRSGPEVLSMAPLPAVVDAWSKRPGDRIVIRYPGGESGEIWAAELRDWLVALGLPSKRIDLVGGGEPERLSIAIR